MEVQHSTVRDPQVSELAPKKGWSLRRTSFPLLPTRSTNGLTLSIQSHLDQGWEALDQSQTLLKNKYGAVCMLFPNCTIYRSAQGQYILLKRGKWVSSALVEENDKK